MNIRQITVPFILASAFFIFLVTGESQADWYLTHGHSGQPAAPALSYKSEGLQVAGFGETVWVHYTIPANGETCHTAQYIKVRYSRYNYAGVANLAAIHVYNGETKIKEFTTGWPPVSYPNDPGPYEPVLDLGSAQTFDKGLGISIAVYFDFNSGADWLTIHAVGADFENSSASGKSGFYVIPVKEKSP